MSQHTVKKTAYVTGNSMKSYAEKKAYAEKEASINQAVVLNKIE